MLYLEDDSQNTALADTLARAGVSVVLCRVAGMNGANDDAQLAFASAQGYVLCTANARDFYRLHGEYLRADRPHAGIIVRTGQRFSLGEQARRIVRIWEALSAEEMVNRTESLSQWGDDREGPISSPNPATR